MSAEAVAGADVERVRARTDDRRATAATVAAVPRAICPALPAIAQVGQQRFGPQRQCHRRIRTVIIPLPRHSHPHHHFHPLRDRALHPAERSLSAAVAPPWTSIPDGLLLTVRLTPKGGRDALDGIAQLADGRAVLKARVRAAASEGEANGALVRLIARTLAVPPTSVSLIAGETARIKRIKIAGNAGALATNLESLTGAWK